MKPFVPAVNKLFIIIGSIVLMFSSNLYAGNQPAVWDQVFETLNTGEILGAAKRAQLSRLIKEIASMPDRPPYLMKTLYARLNAKANDDLVQMRALLDMLKKLSENDSAQDAAFLSSSGIDRCRGWLDLLSADIKEYNVRFSRYEDRHKEKDFMALIEEESKLLISDEKDYYFPGIWKAVQKMMDSVYPKWNRQFADFQARNKKTDSHSRQKYLSVEEKQFLDLFGQVQFILRRFSPLKSNEF